MKRKHPCIKILKWYFWQVILSSLLHLWCQIQLSLNWQVFIIDIISFKLLVMPFLLLLLCIYIYIYISSCAASMDFPDPLSPLISIVHRSWRIFNATSCISTELLYIGSSWSPYPCLSMLRGPQEYITYEFVLTSSAVSH